MKTRQQYWKERTAKRKELADNAKAVLLKMRRDFEKQVLEYAMDREDLTYDAIGEKIGLSRAEVCRICVGQGHHRERGSASVAWRRRVAEGIL